MTAIAYPSAIARACSSIDEALAFRHLPDGYIRVVVRIIKKINLSNLTAPIFASRATLARESGKSLETVGRAIKWLEDNNLVMREQKANAGLRGSRSPLMPTEILLSALTLTERVAQTPLVPHSAFTKRQFDLQQPVAEVLSTTNTSVEIAHSIKEQIISDELKPQNCDINSLATITNTTMHCEILSGTQDYNPACFSIATAANTESAISLSSFHEQSSPAYETVTSQSTTQSDGMTYQQVKAALPVPTDGSICISINQQPKGIQPQRGAFVRMGNVSIPNDLVWLVTNQGLHVSGVLTLMKLASKAKQRLSDIVATTRKYLAALRGRQLFAYLRALIGKDRDYGFLVQKATVETQKSMKQQRLVNKARDLEGRTFSTKDGKILVIIEKNGILTEIHEGTIRGCRPMDQAFIDALDDGRLRSVSVVT